MVEIRYCDSCGTRIAPEMLSKCVERSGKFLCPRCQGPTALRPPIQKRPSEAGPPAPAPVGEKPQTARIPRSSPAAGTSVPPAAPAQVFSTAPRRQGRGGVIFVAAAGVLIGMGVAGAMLLTGPGPADTARTDGPDTAKTENPSEKVPADAGKVAPADPVRTGDPAQPNPGPANPVPTPTPVPKPTPPPPPPPPPPVPPEAEAEAKHQLDQALDLEKKAPERTEEILNLLEACHRNCHPRAKATIEAGGAIGRIEGKLRKKNQFGALEDSFARLRRSRGPREVRQGIGELDCWRQYYKDQPELADHVKQSREKYLKVLGELPSGEVQRPKTVFKCGFDAKANLQGWVPDPGCEAKLAEEGTRNFMKATSERQQVVVSHDCGVTEHLHVLKFACHGTGIKSLAVEFYATTHGMWFCHELKGFCSGLWSTHTIKLGDVVTGGIRLRNSDIWRVRLRATKIKADDPNAAISYDDMVLTNEGAP